MVERIDLAHIPTPLHRLERLSDIWGGDIWIKRDDQTGSGLSGNKVRKLEYLLADARKRKADTVITCGAIQSNHCRATAIASARLGFKCMLLLRGDPDTEIDGNLFLDRLAGAEVHVIPEERYHESLDEELNKLADLARLRGGKPYIVPEGGSNPLGAWGYVQAIFEARDQCHKLGVKPERIICATGSGGTHAGLWVGTRLAKWNTEVISASVCYDSAETVDRIAVIIDGIIDIQKLDTRYSKSEIKVLDGYRGPGYAKATTVEFGVISEALKDEGLIVDPVYTGKAMNAIKSELRAGNFNGTTLFWHTGGMFGIFPFKNKFGDFLTPTI